MDQPPIVKSGSLVYAEERHKVRKLRPLELVPGARRFLKQKAEKLTLSRFLLFNPFVDNAFKNT